jgi:hypothetical protein
MTQTVNPLSQAIDGRKVANDDVLQSVEHSNAMLGSQYDEAVRQWIYNKKSQEGKQAIPAIPVPPLSWVTMPVIYTDEQRLYDAQYPGIDPLITSVQTGPPVRAQYVEPGSPPPPAQGHIDIGQFLRTETRVLNGQSVEIKLYAALPDDTEPAGALVPWDGTVLHKVIKATPWGTAQWYEGV